MNKLITLLLIFVVSVSIFATTSEQVAEPLSPEFIKFLEDNPTIEDDLIVDLDVLSPYSDQFKSVYYVPGTFSYKPKFKSFDIEKWVYQAYGTPESFHILLELNSHRDELAELGRRVDKVLSSHGKRFRYLSLVALAKGQQGLLRKLKSKLKVGYVSVKPAPKITRLTLTEEQKRNAREVWQFIAHDPELEELLSDELSTIICSLLNLSVVPTHQVEYIEEVMYVLDEVKIDHSKLTLLLAKRFANCDESYNRLSPERLAKVQKFWQLVSKDTSFSQLVADEIQDKVNFRPPLDELVIPKQHSQVITITKTIISKLEKTLAQN